MKKLSFLALAGLLIGSLAQAAPVPNEERPVLGAELHYIVPTKPVSGKLAHYLTLNRRDGAQDYTSFTLHEDTGVRCITAPCDSTLETQFNITETLPAIESDSVRYEAIEVLKNIPPNVRIAPRHLLVTQSTTEVASGANLMQRTTWEVEVVPFARPAHYYYAYPEALPSIATE